MLDLIADNTQENGSISVKAISLMNYKNFLSDLCTSLTGVNGAFLFAPPSGIIARQLDHLTNEFNISAIGKKIATIAETAADQMSDITQVEVTFDAMILSGRLLPDKNWLFLLHNPELSGGMIRMALQMALNNSNQESDDTESIQTETPVEDETEDLSPVEEAPVTQEERKQVDIEALMSSGSPLAGPLRLLQDALADLIGPVAIPVFQDILHQWCQEHTPAPNTLKHLIQLIDKEIDVQEDIITFHTQIKDLFPQE
jgi:hypothetical protein